MDTIRLPRDFREFLQLLNENDVRYLLIGGYAVVHYGYVRATGDMDIWVAPEEDNAARLVQAVREFGFDEPDLAPALFLEPGKVVRMGEPPLRLELLSAISGVTFDECYAARNAATFDGVHVPVISVEHLKRNKRASGRHKDLDDLAHLP